MNQPTNTDKDFDVIASANEDLNLNVMKITRTNTNRPEAIISEDADNDSTIDSDENNKVKTSPAEIEDENTDSLFIETIDEDEVNELDEDELDEEVTQASNKWNIANTFLSLTAISAVTILFLFSGSQNRSLESVGELKTLQNSIDSLQLENQNLKSLIGSYVTNESFLSVQEGISNLSQSQESLLASFKQQRTSQDGKIATLSQESKQLSLALELSTSEVKNFNSKLEAQAAAIQTIKDRIASVESKFVNNNLENNVQPKLSKQIQDNSQKPVIAEPTIKRVKTISGMSLESIDVWDGHFIATISKGYFFETLLVGQTYKGYSVESIDDSNVFLINDETLTKVALTR